MQKYYGKDKTYIHELALFQHCMNTTTYDAKNDIYVVKCIQVIDERFTSCKFLLVRVVNHKKMKEMIICMKLVIDKYFENKLQFYR